MFVHGAFLLVVEGFIGDKTRICGSPSLEHIKIDLQCCNHLEDVQDEDPSFEPDKILNHREEHIMCKHLKPSDNPDKTSEVK